MDNDYHFRKLVDEFEKKLNRHLKEDELRLLVWMIERYVEMFEKDV